MDPFNRESFHIGSELQLFFQVATDAVFINVVNNNAGVCVA